jgi:arginase
MRRIAILDAPSNLGLRPPTATSVPGCAKAPGALRDHGLLNRLHARDAGCLTPPRYDPGDWRPGDGVCQAPEVAAYSRRLADRIGAILDAGEFPVILGGDCSILLGSGLAMHRLGEAVDGQIGLVFVDGHTDFRHPGNASYVGAAAGEDLALVTGRGQADLAAIEGRRPYFRDVDVVVMGIRAQDEYRLDLQAAGIVTRPVPTLRVEGAARSAQWAREQLADCAGYWVHVDVDVLDPAVMPAVDAPEPGGIAFPELEILLAGLVDTPHCLGVEITVFDPDYDPHGAYAEEITSTIVAGLTPARSVAGRPDLVRARAESAAEPDDAKPDRFTARRAAAAAESVALAAAGMSDPPAGAPEESAAPATTLLGVEESSEVEARPVEALPEPPPDDFGDDSEMGDSAMGGSARGASARGDSGKGNSEKVDESPESGGTDDDGASDSESDSDDDGDDDGVIGRSGEPAGRPLGSAPLLDSAPLPATRPGMLRPRPAESPPAPARQRDGGFSLPAQRPAFDIGPEEPADIA